LQYLSVDTAASARLAGLVLARSRSDDGILKQALGVRESGKER